jgi:aminopeptidase N
MRKSTPSRLLTSGVVAAVGLGILTASPAYASTPAPGAAGIGDTLFPLLGNGGYEVANYDLNLTYPKKDPAQQVTGTVTITATATQDLSRFDLDFAGDAIATVSVNGAPAKFSFGGGELVVTPARFLPKGRSFTVVVSGFKATPITGTADAPSGFLKTPDGTALTGQPNAAHNLFPSNDHPRDKATYTITLTQPAGWTGTASGQQIRTFNHDGYVTETYREANPMATEVAQIVVGDFVVRSRPPVDGIPIRDVAPTRLAGTLLPEADDESAEMTWLESQAGKYPFENYGSLFIDANINAGLETQTLSLYDTLSADRPIAMFNPFMVHELSHQWFGDSVAPANWSDVWQNEGHATWYEMAYAEKTGVLQDYVGFATTEAFYRAVYGISDELRAGLGPVAGPKSGAFADLFNENVYYGGALTLYALQQKVGAATFQQIERAWAAQFRGQSKSTDDFIALASQVSGQNLTAFLQSWLYGTTTPPMPGHPDWTVNPPSVKASVKLSPPLSH